MSVLDQPDKWSIIDPSSMRNLIRSFPAQLAGAAEAARTLTLPVPPRITAIVIAGMGGSAMGGDIVRVVAMGSLRVPLQVCRDYFLPGYAGSSTLVMASSYSGNTEETLSVYDQARAAGATIVCLTSGGKLATLARSHGYPVIQLPAGLPPRAAIGYSTVMLYGVLAVMGMVPDVTADWRETVGLLTQLGSLYAIEVREADNPAKRIARSMHGRVVAIYASSARLEPAAVRWRGQVEENSKNLAFHHVLPEMNHNELVGWQHPEEILRQLAVVLLRDHGDHAQVQRRFDLTRELLSKKTSVLHEAWSEGESPLARMFSLIYLGDFVSLYLACLNAVDPTPVPVIESFKQRLGEWGAGSNRS